MALKRIGITGIVVGVPLVSDLFDANGRLMLRQGFVVTDIRQAEALMERGLYFEASDDDSADISTSSTQIRNPSVLRMINEVNHRLGKLLHNLANETHAEDKILELAKTVVTAVEINPDIALACILLNQIPGAYAVRHCTDTAIVSILVAKTMKKSADEILSITCAALAMNTAMVSYHDKLQQREGTLTQAELAAMQQHPMLGVNKLQQAGVRNQQWLLYVLQHHENEDGSGYPKGLSGADIAQNAKIISLADRYCARVSSRSYRKSLLPSIALRDIFINHGKSIDPLLSAYFVKELGLYPPGTLVSLHNGEIAIVTKKGPTATTPIVHAILSPTGGLRPIPMLRETADATYAIREVLHEKKLTTRFEMRQLWGEQAAP